MLVLKHANHLDLMWYGVVHQVWVLILERVPLNAGVQYVCTLVIYFPLWKHG